MGKKVNAKEKRLAEQNKRKEITSKNNAAREAALARDLEQQRIAEEARKKAEKERKLKDYAAKVIQDNPDSGKPSKTNAKAAGVKSTFTLDPGKLLMTSFGNGNKAIPEKYVSTGVIEPLSDPENYSAEFIHSDRDFHIRGRASTEATIPNPLEVKSENVDQIHLRVPLEQAVFGTTFSDNIHIQLAYNILDIDKILSLHINNIIYTINNLVRSEDFELFDIVGDLSLAASLEGMKSSSNPDKYKLFQELISSPALGYFGNILWDNKALKSAGSKEKDKEKRAAIKSSVREQMEKKALMLLSVLGEIRQSNAHGSIRTWTGIYSFDSEHDSRMNQKSLSRGERKENLDTRSNSRQVLDQLYSERVREVNNGFLNKANTDLHILISALGARTSEEQTKTAIDYYDFIVKKTYKNLGFSIKKLRQQIVTKYNDSEGLAFSDQSFDSVRHKMNHLLDFMIFRYYRSHENRQNALVEQLRTATTEAWKEAIYEDESQNVWAAIGNEICDTILPNLSGTTLKRLKTSSLIAIDQKQLEKVFLPENASYFSEAVYLMTRFLDGKEINDLLTTLINKFDNIASLIEVLGSPAVNITPSFTPEFSLFANSKTIVEELKGINSFARMSEESADARGVMFEEAATILGYRMPDDQMKEYIQHMLDPEYGRDSFGNKKDNGFRNFIANNVIESDRFRYLVRYANPQKIRKLGKNEMVIRFVLNDIPDAQILRYYNSCKGTDETECREGMRSVLCGLITNMSFEDFEHVKQGNDATPEEKEDKERKKSIIRLYLTVMYLLVKNLVYVNSRYFLAFHCAERDALLTDYDLYKDFLLNTVDKNFLSFAENYLEMYPHLSRLSRRLKEQNAQRLPSKVQKELLTDLQNSDVWTCRVFRNKTEHLEAVRNADVYIADLKQIDSYFSLYHYLMQRTIFNQYNHENGKIGSKSGKVLISPEIINASILRYFDSVSQYHTYCKDFVKALCAPFAYNYPRFKNLTIDGLFDRNRSGEPDKA